MSAQRERERELDLIVWEPRTGDLTKEVLTVSASRVSNIVQLPYDASTRVYPVLRHRERIVNEECPADAPTHTIVEGENYHALQALLSTHAGKVDLIYIDPPYNTGTQDFAYNDKFVSKADDYRHSSWLRFMERRLRLAKEFLSPDGFIAISIDDTEKTNLTLLVERIFQPGSHKTVVVKTAESSGVRVANVDVKGLIPKYKEYVLFIKPGGVTGVFTPKVPKSSVTSHYSQFCENLTNEKREILRKVTNGDASLVAEAQQVLRDMKLIPLSEKFPPTESDGGYEDVSCDYCRWEFLKDKASHVVRLTAMSENYYPVARAAYEKSQQSFNIITTSRGLLRICKGDFDPQQKRPDIQLLFLDDYMDSSPGDFWADIATTGIDTEGGVNFKNGKKPLRLLTRILASCNSPNATFMDFFAGSGTTLEATATLNASDNGQRRCILVTNNSGSDDDGFVSDHGPDGLCQKFTIPRTRNVLQTGYRSNPPLLQRCEVFKVDYLEGQDLTLAAENAVAFSLSQFWIAAGMPGEPPPKELCVDEPYLHHDGTFAVLPPGVAAQDLLNLLNDLPNPPKQIWLVGDVNRAAANHLISRGIAEETLNHQFASYKRAIEKAEREAES